MNFDVLSSSLKSPDAYQTTLAFSGNSLGMFSFKFGYLIDLNFNCPNSGDIYHKSSTQCDSVCPTSFYPDAMNYCMKCGSQCF
jgi:hypothetical protein